MSVPALVALDGVESAIRDMISDGTLTIPHARVVKTMRPQKLLPEFEDDTWIIIFVRSVTREKTSAQWQAYQIDVGVELIRKSRGYGDDHEEERQMMTFAQTISDELAKRKAVELQFMSSNTAGMLEAASIEQLDLVSIMTSHVYRIMHEIV